MQRYASRVFLAVCILTVACSACRAAKPAVQELEVQADDVTLHARVAGDPGSGDVLIAIHGGPGMSSDYMLSLEQLAGPELAVVTYDQRGTGRSTEPSQGYAMLKYVADLDAVREAVGADRVIIMGHSWGGVLALRYATVHPERVRSIALMGSGPPSLSAARAGQLSRAQRIMELQREGIILEAISSVLDILPAYFSDPRFELPEELKNVHYNESVERLTWSALGEYDFTEELGDLAHPVLMVWGEDDPFGLSMAEATRSALSDTDVEFVVLEGCGHFWHECPEAFFSAVRAFLGVPAQP
jgi:pimeloyl-ACP methyl ester carboxylesterase